MRIGDHVVFYSDLGHMKESKKCCGFVIDTYQLDGKTRWVVESGCDRIALLEVDMEVTPACRR